MRSFIFCNCDLSWRSTEFFLLPCSKALSAIFAVMNCYALALIAVFCSRLLTRIADNACSLQWHIAQQQVNRMHVDIE